MGLARTAETLSGCETSFEELGEFSRGLKGRMRSDPSTMKSRISEAEPESGLREATIAPPEPLGAIEDSSEDSGPADPPSILSTAIPLAFHCGPPDGPSL